MANCFQTMYVALKNTGQGFIVRIPMMATGRSSG